MEAIAISLEAIPIGEAIVSRLEAISAIALAKFCALACCDMRRHNHPRQVLSPERPPQNISDFAPTLPCEPCSLLSWRTMLMNRRHNGERRSW